MADYDRRQSIAWVFTALLVILLVLSVMGDGTWMAGLSMGWMMVVPVLLFLGTLYFAYRYGRLLERAGPDQQRPRP